MAESQPQATNPQTEQSESQSKEDVQNQAGDAEAEEEYLDEQPDVLGGFQPTEQLDSRFAVIEEQFRKSFEERFGSQKTKKQFWEDEAEIMRTSKIFRTVSRGIVDEWRPIFADLMAKFPPEVIEEEKANIEKQQVIIQSYKALSAWKDRMGPNYTAILLVDVLRKHNMDDLADEVLNILDGFDVEKEEKKDEKIKKEKKFEWTGRKRDNKTDETTDKKDDQGDKKEDQDDKKDGKDNNDDKSKNIKQVQRKKSDVAAKAKQGVLDNRRLLLLAKQVGEGWEPLGKALAVPEEELAEIRGGEDSKTYQGAFKVLWSWRQTQPANETEESRNILKVALEKVGKPGLLEQLETK